MEAGGWPPLGYKWEEGGGAPVTHLSLWFPCYFFFLASLLAASTMAPIWRFSAAEKGKAPQAGPSPPPPAKRSRGHPRKYTTVPVVASRGNGGGSLRGGERLVADGGHAVGVRSPRPRFHSAEVLPEFVMWSTEPTGTRLPLPRFLLGELPAGAPGGLWL